MTDNYVNGIKEVKVRPNIKNNSTMEDFSSSENEDVIQNSDSSEDGIEINNNLRQKNAVEYDEDMNNSQNSDKKEFDDESSSQKDEKNNPYDKNELRNNMSLENKHDDLKKTKEINLKIILILTVIFLSVLYKIYLPKTIDKKKICKIDLDQLKKNYPNQSNNFWINIESSYKHSVVKSKDPSIILMIYDEQTAATYLKLSQEILNNLNKIDCSSSHVIINSKNDNYFNGLIESDKLDESKFYLDSELSDYFKSGGKLALIEDIQRLPAHSMVLFYAYGDEEKYAKFPGILIFMSLKLDYILDAELKDNYLARPKLLREFAEKYMFEMWSKKIGEDQLKPLFTRIANNVILVNRE